MGVIAALSLFPDFIAWGSQQAGLCRRVFAEMYLYIRTMLGSAEKDAVD
jgi:hypothetical protein